MWHVLTVAPQAEFKVRDCLHGEGLKALVPVEFRFRRPARGGRPLPIRRPRVPGYVFADVPDYSLLHTVKGWKGAIFSDGRPYILADHQVRAIEALSVPLQAIETPGRFRIGQKIALKKGALAVLETVVEEIRGGQICLAYSLLGKRHRSWVSSASVG